MIMGPQSFIFFRTSSDGDKEIRRSSNFRDQDDGVYTCAVTDQGGNSQYLYIGVYRTISPNFTMVNLDINLSFEDDRVVTVTLNCSSSALPVMRVRWYFNNQLIMVGEETQLIADTRSTTYNSLLKIRSNELSQEMLEPGLYRCFLESETSSVNVTQMQSISKAAEHNDFACGLFLRWLIAT